MTDGEANVWQPKTIIQISADTKAVEEKLTAIAGQSLFTLITFAYVLNTGALEVHKNGLLLAKGTDWVEQTTTTFSLVTPALVGDIVVASGHVGITGAVDVRDTDIFVTNYQAIRDYAGTEITLYAQGQTTVGDAGESFFQKITGAAPGFYVDNDDTIIVPTGGDGSIGWVRTKDAASDITYTPAATATNIAAVLDALHLDTVAELQAVTTIGLTRADVGGNTTLGDDAGGRYWFDTSDVVTADDGYRNIIDSQAVRAGTWKLIDKKWDDSVTYTLGDWTYGKVDGMLYFLLAATSLNENPETDVTATKWRAADQLRTVDAGGTVDAITATFVPIFAALKKSMIFVVTSSGPNTTGALTLNVNGTGAKTIVKHGNSGLEAGDTGAAGYPMLIQYSVANTNYELLNPRNTNRSLSNLTAAGNEKILHAWISFNGQGTIAINDSFNVASIVDNGPGDYTVNYTNAIGNNNYSAVSDAFTRNSNIAAIASGSLDVKTWDSSEVAFDPNTVCVQVASGV